MKRTSINFVLVILNIVAFYFVACQKDQDSATSALASAETVQTEATAGEGAQDRAPLILADLIENYCICKSGRTCGSWAYTISKLNGVRITLDPVTHAYYNATGPGLRYRIYAGGSCSGATIADFTCNQPVVEYSSGLLNNSTTYRVLISKGTSTSPCYSFTTGTCKGQSCTGGGGQ